MLRLTTVIMASVKSDKAKQSLDDLEKISSIYRR